MNIEEHWPREVELTVGDRLWLLQLLPKEGSVTTMRALADFRTGLPFTPEEIEKWQIRLEGGAVFQNSKGETKKFSVGRLMWELAQETLEGLEKKKKLNVECVELYGKFCERKEEEKV